MSTTVTIAVDHRDSIAYAYGDALRAVAAEFDRGQGEHAAMLDDRIGQCIEILTAPWVEPAPIERACEGCLADPGEPCRPGCLSEPDCEHGNNDGGPCPTCDHCGRSQCSTEYLTWNGETGCHVECETVEHPTCDHDERTSIATCGICERAWCYECDPGPSALCPWCHGRGYSTAPRASS